MNRRRRPILLIAGLAGIAAAGIAVRSAVRLAREFRTRDAVIVLQNELQSELEHGRELSVSEVNAMALRLDRASVCYFRFDSEGNALDSWGTPLRIDLSTGAVVSAGPDARFESGDDIRAQESEPHRP